jgi:N-acyl-D-aspartate/D-glutamate deacylase
VVNGEVVLRDGKPTGALPGQLLRGGARGAGRKS